MDYTAKLSLKKNGVRVRVRNTQVSTRFSYKCKYFLLVFNIFLLILLSIPSLPDMQQTEQNLLLLGIFPILLE